MVLCYTFGYSTVQRRCFAAAGEQGQSHDACKDEGENFLADFIQKTSLSGVEQNISSA